MVSVSTGFLPIQSAVVFVVAGHIEFTWQQVMIGIQSSIIMFPINLLIVSIFRNTRLISYENTNGGHHPLRKHLGRLHTRKMYCSELSGVHFCTLKMVMH